MDNVMRLLAGADAPRPLPDGLRARLEGALLASAAGPAIDLRGIDAPRALPPHLRRSLRRLIERRRISAWRAGVAVAAAAALVIGIVAIPNGIRRAQPPAAIGPTAQPSPGSSPKHAVGLPLPSPAPSAGIGAGAGTGNGMNAPGAASHDGSPPPFDATVRVRAGSSRPAAPPPPPAGGGPVPMQAVPPPAPRVPARIAVTGADPDVSAGFEAYVALVRAQGEVGNRTFEIVRASPNEPAENALVTVNLGSSSIAGAAWIDGPMLDSLDARAADGNVFDIASTPRRQARVLADRLLADTDLGKASTSVAVVYRVASGEFAQTVPDEITKILEDAGVVVLRVDYEPDGTTLVPADIAILSMRPAEAATFARQARKDGYAPRLGLAGIWSLYDDTVRAELHQKLTLVSPYWAPENERDAIRKGAAERGGRMGAGAIHGWATAKAIATALYESDPRTPAQMAQALTVSMRLGVCPYGLRAGSHERTPDGVIVQGTRDGYGSKGSFFTDERA